MPVQTVLPYAALLAAMMIVLSFRISFARRRSGVSLGVGDDPVLLERVRAFGNFAEWTPMALLLIVLAELAGAPAGTIHLAGGLLVLGRVLHPLGLRASALITLSRFLGMVFTYTSMIIVGIHVARVAIGL